MIILPHDWGAKSGGDKEQRRSKIAELESSLFGGPGLKPEVEPTRMRYQYDVDTVSQGRDGYEKVQDAIRENKDYRLVFIDMRMPPGWNGAETAASIRKI